MVKIDAQTIIEKTIAANLPDAAVKAALDKREFSGNVYLLAIGKAAWVMAKAASDSLGDRIKQGVVITKYDHSQGAIPNVEIIEAGHPISDENTIIGTEKAIALVENLTAKDEILFLVSGGGSALFESPRDGISLADIVALNKQLLASGADIVEINMIRKRLSKVKAGRFAELCKATKIFTIVLSDVVGDRLDSIASGPAAPDNSTAEEALAVVEKYQLKLNDTIMKYLELETPKAVNNVETVITGSVRTLCDSAANEAKALGYEPLILSTTIGCEASQAGEIMGTIANEIDRSEYSIKRPCAVIIGGETVVQLRGSGKGGRNIEMALKASTLIAGLEDVAFFSLGSDGTDGPTDAAGGLVDGETLRQMQEKGLDAEAFLANNDSYNVLKEVDCLIITGPTGTNVNDVSVLLCK
jgi:Putative glycerate kinase